MRYAVNLKKNTLTSRACSLAVSPVKKAMRDGSSHPFAEFDSESYNRHVLKAKRLLQLPVEQALSRDYTEDAVWLVLEEVLPW